MKLVNSTTLGASDNKLDLLTITKAKPVVDDPVFQGVTKDMEPFEFYVGYYEYLDDVMDGNTGEVLMQLNDDAVFGAGRPLLIRWDKEEETYPGSGVINTAPRSFLCVGSDNSPQNPPSNYSNYTTPGLKLLLNEVRHLAAPEKEPARNNLVINGDLERGNFDTTWVESNTLGEAVFKAGLNTKEPINGNYDYLMDVTTAGTSDGRPFFVFYLRDTVRVGDECTLTFKTRVLTGTPAIKYINYGIGVKNVSLVLTGVQEWTYSFTANQKTTALVFFVNGTMVSSFQIDDVTLIRSKSVGSKRIADKETKLAATCYPNPFSTSATFAYRLERESTVDLSVYDITGKKVRTLVHRKQLPGERLAVWNGCGDGGEPLPSGLFFYRLTAGDESVTGKVLLRK